MFYVVKTVQIFYFRLVINRHLRNDDHWKEVLQ